MVITSAAGFISRSLQQIRLRRSKRPDELSKAGGDQIRILIQEGDPGGKGLWSNAGEGSFVLLPRLLWESGSHWGELEGLLLNPVYLGRMVDAKGLEHVLTGVLQPGGSKVWDLGSGV